MYFQDALLQLQEKGHDQSQRESMGIFFNSKVLVSVSSPFQDIFIDQKKVWDSESEEEKNY